MSSARTPYTIFASLMMKAFKDQEEQTGKKIPFGEKQKMIGQAWKAKSDAQKKTFEEAYSSRKGLLVHNDNIPWIKDDFHFYKEQQPGQSDAEYIEQLKYNCDCAKIIAINTWNRLNDMADIAKIRFEQVQWLAQHIEDKEEQINTCLSAAPLLSWCFGKK